jgi:hypothetical protein
VFPEYLADHHQLQRTAIYGRKTISTFEDQWMTDQFHQSYDGWIVVDLRDIQLD